VEQWRKPKWRPVIHLDSSQSVTGAIAALQKRDQAGLYRVVQTQRILWLERTGGQLKAHGCHTSSPENLAELTNLFEREGGRRPVEKARQDRAKAKAQRAAK
jgi:hypothetical protein